MGKIISNFLAKIKARKEQNRKVYLKLGLTWKNLNPKSLKNAKLEN